jgi:hypothetical protein
MCQSCLKDVQPDRGSFVSDNGHFITNFKACIACSKREMPVSRARTRNGVPFGGLSGGSSSTNGHGTANGHRDGDRPEINGPADTTEDNEPREYGEDGEEVSFEHVCVNCEHLIARHVYRFNVTKASSDVNSWTQSYEMECDLCGFGERENSVGVSDPKRRAEAGYAMVADD